jgi:MFS family permease
VRVGETAETPAVATTAGATTGSTPSRSVALYTGPFIGTCLVMVLAFAQNFTLQPILPLLVLDLGGDAAFVGLAFLVFTIPSVALRPYIGRLADRLGTRPILLIGAAGIALAGPLYLIPSLAVLAVLRVFHGTVWAAFNTGAPSLMASIVPASRRGEASAAFDLMPGLAVLIMPTIALITYGAFGLTGALGLAAVLGVATLLVAVWLIPTSVGARPSQSTSGGSLLEPTAVLPMVFQLLTSAVISLFVVYPPIFAAQHDIPLSGLIVYYPVYGVAFVASRIVAGRIVDRIPRVSVMIGGAALAGVALLLAAPATGVALLTVAGVLYAIASGATAPATTALVMDRAPAGRVGAAMATYTLGFQFGSGLGAAVFGLLIDSSGFVIPFLLGAALQFALVALVVARRAGLRPVPA